MPRRATAQLPIESTRMQDEIMALQREVSGTAAGVRVIGERLFLLERRLRALECRADADEDSRLALRQLRQVLRDHLSTAHHD